MLWGVCGRKDGIIKLELDVVMVCLLILLSFVVVEVFDGVS